VKEKNLKSNTCNPVVAKTTELDNETSHFTGIRESREKNGQKKVSLEATRRDGGDVTWRRSSYQTWAAATGYARSVMTMMLSKDDLEPQGSKTGGSRLRGTLVQTAELDTSLSFIPDSLQSLQPMQLLYVRSTAGQ